MVNFDTQSDLYKLAHLIQHMQTRRNLDWNLLVLQVVYLLCSQNLITMYVINDERIEKPKYITDRTQNIILILDSITYCHPYQKFQDLQALQHPQ
jgi:hypothetical protein